MLIAARFMAFGVRHIMDVVHAPHAGRMQDNEPLMRALSALIAMNSPDLVLFVGEALVGNDAVDQLSKFNSRLADLAPDAATAHCIDGILLTKFDTIDDKVGNSSWRDGMLPSALPCPVQAPCDGIGGLRSLKDQGQGTSWP